MTAAPGLVTASLQRAAEVGGDPRDLVFEELFARVPDVREMFVMDRTGAVRGNMLANIVEVILDMDGEDRYGRNMLWAEMTNHDNLGVPRDRFFVFFDVLCDVTARLLGPEWSPETAAAWDALVARARALDGERAGA